MNSREMIACTVTFIRSTKDAVLVRDGDKDVVWLPKSQIEYDNDGGDPGTGTIIDVNVPEWLAEEKDLL